MKEKSILKDCLVGAELLLATAESTLSLISAAASLLMTGV
jgi:hypothetical protein